MSSYIQMAHFTFDGSCQYFQEFILVKGFWMIFAKLFRLFSSASYTKHSFFKCYLISETLAAMKWLQIRCKVVFRLSGYCTCENVMAKPSHPVTRVGKKTHENMLTYQFFSPTEKQTIGIAVCSYRKFRKCIHYFSVSV